MSRAVLLVAAIVLAALVITGISSMYTVNQTQHALVLQFGSVRDRVSEPGLHFKVPFIQNVVYIDKRVLDLDTPAEEVIAADQKRLVVDAFARYRIIDPLLFYQTVRDQVRATQQLNAVVSSSMRQILGGQAFATVLSGERAQLMRAIRDVVNGEARAYGIEIVDVRIRRADLPEANSQAIFRRMQTEREREAKEVRAQGAEVAQRIRARADREKAVLLADAQRQSQVNRGEGDAEASRIFAEAFGKDPQFYGFYRSMQAYRDSLGGDSTTMILSPQSQFFQYFNSKNLPGGGRPQAAPAQ
jgi:membrane protease subunit HflC